MDQALGIFDSIFGRPTYTDLPYTFDRMDDLEKAQENNTNEAERLGREKDIEQERVNEKERTEREKKM